MTKIAVFGAGTWGIALARLLAANGRDVTVWSAIPAELKSLSTTHRHPNLPGMELPAERSGGRMKAPISAYPQKSGARR